jgi:hypothetical protein
MTKYFHGGKAGLPVGGTSGRSSAFPRKASEEADHAGFGRCLAGAA